MHIKHTSYIMSDPTWAQAMLGHLLCLSDPLMDSGNHPSQLAKFAPRVLASGCSRSSGSSGTPPVEWRRGWWQGRKIPQPFPKRYPDHALPITSSRSEGPLVHGRGSSGRHGGWWHDPALLLYRPRPGYHVTAQQGAPGRAATEVQEAAGEQPRGANALLRRQRHAIRPQQVEAGAGVRQALLCQPRIDGLHALARAKFALEHTQGITDCLSSRHQSASARSLKIKTRSGRDATFQSRRKGPQALVRHV